MRHIYCDESVFAEPKDYVASGVLISEGPIMMAITAEALNALSQFAGEQNPFVNRLDATTLERGYFHASKDSQNGHRCLCAAVRRDVKGVFRAQFFNRSEISAGAVKVSEVFMKSAWYAAMPGLDSRDPVKFVFARREGVTESALRQWHRAYHTELVRALSCSPEIPAFFPELLFEIVDPSDPG